MALPLLHRGKRPPAGTGVCFVLFEVLMTMQARIDRCCHIGIAQFSANFLLHLRMNTQSSAGQ